MLSYNISFFEFGIYYNKKKALSFLKDGPFCVFSANYEFFRKCSGPNQKYVNTLPDCS
ncbi:unknown protein [Paenibacillus amylolyticus]|uniref:Uncharacterized protein n=1 Tax=Paenibacillus amylolyticus TaxID=1451 RepID=A0A100VJK8_PAEAM|nr:unknown protein [Paenibacillus amylolyticus]